MKLTLMPTAVLCGLLVLGGCSMKNESANTTAPQTPVRVASDRQMIPSGTSFAVRANQTIETSQAGGVFAAEIAQDIENSRGELLVPKGSPAELQVVQVTSGGTVGTPTMELALRSLTVNGTRYNVMSGTETARGDEGLGANRRTAIMTGGGALLGTLIGAAAGGGSGAAIGAAVGAAGGAAAQVLTRGEQIKVPAETVMTFRLDQPLQLSRS